MGITTLVEIINDATSIGGIALFGVCLLTALWLLVYMRRRHVTPTHEAITGASWATMMVSLPMRYLGLVNDWVLGITILLCIGSIVLLANRE